MRTVRWRHAMALQLGPRRGTSRAPRKLIRESARRGAQLIRSRICSRLRLPARSIPRRPLGTRQARDAQPSVDHFAPWRSSLSASCCRSAYSNAPTIIFTTAVVVVREADGSVLGSYRKSQIRRVRATTRSLFLPRETGFKVFDTRLRRKLGVAIFWDHGFRRPHAPWR